MTNNEVEKIVLGQHYYHFVVLRSEAIEDLNSHWKRLGAEATGYSISDASGDVHIQHAKYVSHSRFGGESALEKLSLTGDGEPPFGYDLFATQHASGMNRVTTLAFPFARLATHLLRGFVAESGSSAVPHVHFANVQSVLNSATDSLHSDDIDVFVVGLEVAAADESHLAMLRMRGDDPLESSIYKDFISGSIQGTEHMFTPTRCVLSCELQLGDGAQSHVLVPRKKIRTRVHMDALGHFKLYVHMRGGNLIVVPHLLRLLATLKCLKEPVPITEMKGFSMQDDSD